MTNLLLVLLLQRAHRNDAFLWKHPVVLHDFVEHHFVNVRMVMPTGGSRTDIALCQEETQGERVFRRDSAVDLPDPILLRILIEFLKKHTTNTLTPRFLTDNQWTDFDRALVLGYEVENADDVAIFVIHRHIHQLFG